MKKGLGIVPWICGAGAIVLGAFGLFTVLDGQGNENEKINLIIGTYGESIYEYSFDTKSLEFEQEKAFKAENGSYCLAYARPDGLNVYSVSETGNGSGVYSFNTKASAEKRQTGADPCFVLMHDGYMMTADYSGGSISVFPILADGSVGDISQQLTFHGSGPVKDRQESSHIHQLRLIPNSDSRWILASDLGADKIWIISTKNPKENMPLAPVSSIDCPAGSGPRHMEFNAVGDKLYCIAELSGNVLVYDIDKSGETPELTLIQEIKADEVDAGGSADIHMHPNGKYLYTSHRLENDGIAIFSINPDGRLSKIGYVNTDRHPRNFMITADGSLLLVACRDDHSIQVFRIEKDGGLTKTPSVLKFQTDKPSSVTAVIK